LRHRGQECKHLLAVRLWVAPHQAALPVRRSGQVTLISPAPPDRLGAEAIRIEAELERRAANAATSRELWGQRMSADRTQRASALPPQGVTAALPYRLRQAVATLPPAEAAALLGELRGLVSAYCPWPPRAVAWLPPRGAITAQISGVRAFLWLAQSHLT
jgi:hypothetical protein